MVAPTQVAKPGHDGYKKLMEVVGGNKDLWNVFHYGLVGRSEDDEALLRMVIRTQECLAKTGKAIIKIDPELIGEKNATLLPAKAEEMERQKLVVYNRETQEIALTRRAAELVLARLEKGWKGKMEIPSLRDAFIEPEQIFMSGKSAT